MLQQYYRTVSWNPYIRNVATDEQELVTLAQLTTGSLPTDSNKFQVHCILSVLDGPNTGLYSNSGTVQTPNWSNIIISPVIRVSVVLTPTEILQLNSTPVEIAPAPGVGKYIIPQQCFVKFVNGGINYTNAGFTNITVGNTGNNLFQFGGVINGASTVRIYFPVNSATLFENSPAQIFNTISNPTLGNGDVEFILYYQIALATL